MPGLVSALVKSKDVYDFSSRKLCSTWSCSQQKFQGPAIVGPPFPYYSQKYGNDMEGLWEGGPTIEGPWKNP